MIIRQLLEDNTVKHTDTSEEPSSLVCSLICSFTLSFTDIFSLPGSQLGGGKLIYTTTFLIKNLLIGFVSYNLTRNTFIKIMNKYHSLFSHDINYTGKYKETLENPEFNSMLIAICVPTKITPLCTSSVFILP